MSDGGRGRASLGVKVWKSFQKWSVQRSAVRSIAWLGLLCRMPVVINSSLIDDNTVEASPRLLPAPTLRCAGLMRLDVLGRANWIERLGAVGTSRTRRSCELTTRGTGLQIWLKL